MATTISREPSFESLDGFFPEHLGHVAVQRSTGETTGFELFREFNGGDLGADEDDHGIDFFGFKDTGQGVEFVKPLDLPETLGDFLDRRSFALDADVDRVLEVLVGDAQDLFRHGS